MINHGPNRTEILFMDSSIFLSYATPVAFYDYKLRKVFVSEEKYSVTTTRHIKKWIDTLVDNRGFPSKDSSPESYGTATQDTLQTLWNKATATKSAAKHITPSGEMNWKHPTISSRMNDILSE